MAKELVAKLKFERCRAAGTPMARAMAGLIAGHPKEIGLVHIPTASSRARMRGYDQSQLLAKRIAQITGLPCLSLLHRQGQLRQVGRHRAERSRQLSGAFWVSDYAVSPNITYILVDDVITTGSTFVAAATALQKAGATKLMGISFAAA
ncbi:MAG TPA: hypothetical protein VFT16_05405 [Candidatus Saccharimonadales bacterium]|nr:hypothetical protein [Candidatus Saccharimonadales bacterium]